MQPQPFMSVNISSFPPEILWRIFLFTNYPKHVYTVLPNVCKAFSEIISSQPLYVLGNIDLITEEEEDANSSSNNNNLNNINSISFGNSSGGSSNSALLQAPDRSRFFYNFKRVVVHLPYSSQFPNDDISRNNMSPTENSPTVSTASGVGNTISSASRLGRNRAGSRRSNVSSSETFSASAVTPIDTGNLASQQIGGGLNSSQMSFSPLASPVNTESPTRNVFVTHDLISYQRPGSTGIAYHMAAERDIMVNMSAIPERPESLVAYIGELLGRGVLGRKSKRRAKIIFGTLQIKGRRGNISADLLGRFLRAMNPVNVTLWWWDSLLISAIPSTVSTVRLPNMKADGHIQFNDMSLLLATHPTRSQLRRLELFRPMPRQPWGLEVESFTSLASLLNLRELVVQSGRLIGNHEVLVDSILQLRQISVIELPWHIDSRYAIRLLRDLPQLTSFQYIAVTSPDFFLSLPTHHAQTTPLETLYPRPNLQSVPLRRFIPSAYHVNPEALKLKSLGLHYTEPDMGDLAVMVEGIVRSFPGLSELFLRIHTRNSESTYDFFGGISREFMERSLRRLEAKTNLVEVSVELGLRLWGSRKSYADDLVNSFSESRLKLRIHSPMGRIGF